MVESKESLRVLRLYIEEISRLNSQIVANIEEACKRGHSLSGFDVMNIPRILTYGQTHITGRNTLIYAEPC